MVLTRRSRQEGDAPAGSGGGAEAARASKPGRAKRAPRKAKRGSKKAAAATARIGEEEEEDEEELASSAGHGAEAKAEAEAEELDMDALVAAAWSSLAASPAVVAAPKAPGASTGVQDCLSSSLKSPLESEARYIQRQGDGTAAYAEAEQASARLGNASVMHGQAGVPGFAPPLRSSTKAMKRKRKKEEPDTLGPNWFHLPATPMTEELKQELKLLKMRNMLNPKRHYKTNDSKKLPKYFQMGTVIEGPAEYYTDRSTKKQRKQTLVDELLADAQFKKYNKTKFLALQTSRARGGRFHERKDKLKKRPKKR